MSQEKQPYRTRRPGSILKERPDGLGFWYGFTKEGNRVDIRWEPSEDSRFGGWTAYLAGDKVGQFRTIEEAEQGALYAELGYEPTWATKMKKRLRALGARFGARETNEKYH
jgi:hypothetical protein